MKNADFRSYQKQGTTICMGKQTNMISVWSTDTTDAGSRGELMERKRPKCGRAVTGPGREHSCVKPRTVDEYIAAQAEPLQPVLREVRAILQSALPEAEERISWSMPTYWKGRNLIHFAASKKHLGIYPGDGAAAAFAEELADYDTGKGTIRLPYDAPLPADLIRRIAAWCFETYAK